VSKSVLSQSSSRAPAVAEKPITSRAKFEISYAPGVHAGSDRRIGPAPVTVNDMTTCAIRSTAVS
jgi:hypothetical protein